MVATGETEGLDRDHLAIALLVEAGAVLAGSLDFATTISQVARLTVPSLADLCIVDLCDSGGSIAELAAASAEPALARALEDLRARFPLDPGGAHPVARVIRSGRAELLPDMSRTELTSFAQGGEHARFMIEHGYRSAVVAPLAARAQTLGTMSILRLGESPPYGEADLALACELARRAALAIDNARLFSELSGVEQRLQAVLENVAEAITVIDASGHTVYANPAAATLLGAAAPEELTDGSPGETMKRFQVLDEAGRELSLDAMPARRIFRGETPRPLLVRNIVRDTGEERWLNVRASPIHDAESGRILYAVNVLENVTAVKRAQLAEAFMAQASRVLASSFDYAETLRRVARLAAAQVTGWCAVDVVGEHGELERVAVHHDDPRRLALAERLDFAYRPALSDEGGVAEVIRTGVAQIVNDISDKLLAAFARDAEHLRLLREIEARDAIIVPLAAPTRTLGAITLLSSRSGRRLTEADLDLAVRLARRAGTAVESARLYTERTQIAQTLQRALLPDSLPHIEGLEIAASYRAAGETNEVGGDFYDVYPCGEERWALAIGDVCGKGPAAAAVTALARHTLRAVAMYGERPAGMLQALHQILLQQGAGLHMCTVCIVAFGRPGRTATLTIALGGHPQPLLVGRAGAVAAVGAPGTVLGVVDPITIEEVEVELGEGETLLLYTDGVAEASAGARDALMDRAAGAPRLALDELLEGIERSALTGAGGRARDDMALLALRLAGRQAG